MQTLRCGSKSVYVKFVKRNSNNSAAQIGNFISFLSDSFGLGFDCCRVYERNVVCLSVCVCCLRCPCLHLMFQPLRGWHLTAAPFLTIMLAGVSGKIEPCLSFVFQLVSCVHVYCPYKRGFNVVFWICLTF